MTTKFTFHYASTLSGSLRRSLLSSLIYIPLCFYFISSAAHAAIFFFPIYIPLCFYFILTKSTKSSCNCLFTFHYASTLSLISTQNTSHNHNLHSTMLLLYLLPVVYCIDHSVFTFHYASTLSKKSRLSPRLIHDLHSTMLLLYRGGERDGRHERDEFTFHYASTLSVFNSVKSTATSVIYIPLCFYFIEEHEYIRTSITIYIPLCFYFILDELLDLMRKIHLHSTMLLLYPPRYYNR